ncbi:protein kinase domain-containing protein [Neorhodopirellula lusitana]|uniref:protein kinase domain-containing protein n=1 Tax=Neorhodopirellula lusitana TaxID=445327 RepID=UPI00384B4046
MDSLDDAQTFDSSKRKPIQNDGSLGDEVTTGPDREQSLGNVDGFENPVDVEFVNFAARYEIVGELGRGGMGEVLKANDRRLQRLVAIKRLRAGLVDSQRAIQRFQSEARAVAALNHFNVVQVYDFGRDEDGFFIVMELVNGGSLSDRIRSKGKMDTDEAVDLIVQVCGSLALAHRNGIIHRDIKPANILLTPDGVPKLTDFGLARLELSETEHTQAGTVLGTIDFMPPEQRRDSSAVDARSDLWSLAASFYQLVTGKSPRVIRSESIPSMIREVVLTALEDDPEERYPTVEDFRDALLAAQADELQSQAEVSLAPGQCSHCGHQNTSDNEFCLSCGHALSEACPGCGEKIDAWAKFCGKCGVDVAAKVTQRLEQLEKEKLRIAKLRQLGRHDEVAQRLAAIARLKHSALSAYTHWAESSIEQIKAEQARNQQQHNELLIAAKQQLAESNYDEALSYLNQISDPSQNAEAAQLLEQTQRNAARLRELTATIRERLDAKQYEGLESLVQEFLKLKPNDNSARGLLRKLQRRGEQNATSSEIVDAIPIDDEIDSQEDERLQYRVTKKKPPPPAIVKQIHRLQAAFRRSQQLRWLSISVAAALLGLVLWMSLPSSPDMVERTNPPATQATTASRDEPADRPAEMPARTSPAATPVTPLKVSPEPIISEPATAETVSNLPSQLPISPEATRIASPASNPVPSPANISSNSRSAGPPLVPPSVKARPVADEPSINSVSSYLDADLPMPNDGVVYRFAGQSSPISCLEFSSDSQFLLSGTARLSADEKNSVEMWDLKTGNHLRTLIGSQLPWIRLALSSNDRAVAGLSNNSQILLWETATGKQVGTLKGADIGIQESIVDIAFLGTRKLAVCTSNGYYSIDLPTRKSEGFGENVGSRVGSCSFARQTTKLILGQERGGLTLWDTREINQIGSSEIRFNHVAIGDTQQPRIESMSVTPNAHNLVISTSDRAVVWDLVANRGRSELNPLAYHSGRQLRRTSSRFQHTKNTVDITPDGSYALMVTPYSIHLWDAQAGPGKYHVDFGSDLEPVRTFQPRQAADSPYCSARFSPQGFHFAVGQYDGTVKVYISPFVGLTRRLAKIARHSPPPTVKLPPEPRLPILELENDPNQPILIETFTPVSGTAGDRVTIQGRGFSKAKKVWFVSGHEPLEASFDVTSDSQIVATVPDAIEDTRREITFEIEFDSGLAVTIPKNCEMNGTLVATTRQDSRFMLIRGEQNTLKKPVGDFVYVQSGASLPAGVGNRLYLEAGSKVNDFGTGCEIVYVNTQSLPQDIQNRGADLMRVRKLYPCYIDKRFNSD